MPDRERERKKAVEDMTAEELERRLRETFFCPDRIDEGVFRELEELREALDRKQPLENDFDPEEGWQRFLHTRAEELSRTMPAPKRRKGVIRARPRVLLRRVLLAAVIAVLLAGAALAADYAGLWAWAPRWNAAAGRYEPAATEVSGESPIPAALAELGITEPVYPAKLPEGFVITESRISEEPLVLMEQYARGDRHFSITVTPIDGFRISVYQRGGEPAREYASGRAINYVFETERTVTAIWYTKHYATSVSGNLSLTEIKEIMDSLPAAAG